MKKATDARRAFPCFDEPDFKAIFDVNIIAENHKTVLSNMVFFFVVVATVFIFLNLSFYVSSH